MENEWMLSPDRHIYYNTWGKIKDKESHHELIVGGFDMDDTLINTKSGKIHPVNKDDWRWLPTIGFDRMIEAFTQNKLDVIAILTNRGAKDVEQWNDLRVRVTQIGSMIYTASGIPVIMISCNAKGYYRKPSTGMWDKALSLLPSMTETTVPVSSKKGQMKKIKITGFYVGDAAGRSDDFACSDRMMAYNAGIPFYTPEEYFLGVPVDSIPWVYPSNPVIPSRQRWTSHESVVLDRLSTMCARTDRLTVIMGVGYPGSGKSGWVKKIQNKLSEGVLDVIGADILRQRKLAGEKITATVNTETRLIRESLLQGHHVFIDNTHGTAKTRKVYLDWIETIRKSDSLQIDVVCLWLQTDMETSYHFNQIRCQKSRGRIGLIPMVAYYTFRKRFQEPTVEEGYSQVESVRSGFLGGKWKF